MKATIIKVSKTGCFYVKCADSPRIVGFTYVHIDGYAGETVSELASIGYKAGAELIVTIDYGFSVVKVELFDEKR